MGKRMKIQSEVKRYLHSLKTIEFIHTITVSIYKENLSVCENFLNMFLGVNQKGFVWNTPDNGYQWKHGENLWQATLKLRAPVNTPIKKQKAIIRQLEANFDRIVESIKRWDLCKYIMGNNIIKDEFEVWFKVRFHSAKPQSNQVTILIIPYPTGRDTDELFEKMIPNLSEWQMRGKNFTLSLNEDLDPQMQNIFLESLDVFHQAWRKIKKLNLDKSIQSFKAIEL